MFDIFGFSFFLTFSDQFFPRLSYQLLSAHFSKMKQKPPDQTGLLYNIFIFLFTLQLLEWERDDDFTLHYNTLFIIFVSLSLNIFSTMKGLIYKLFLMFFCG